MQILSKNDYKILTGMFRTTQKGLRKAMLELLRQKYDAVYHTKDYIMAIGTTPVAVMAHLDTVFPSPPKHIYYDREQGIMWSPDGLGADDRAGVFLIYKLINSGFRPTIILTTDEEKGGVGADALVSAIPEMPCEINYIIELDRRGKDDCVFYDCNNRSFVEYIEKFGFYENYGTFTDISVICPAWSVAGVNLSVGYDNEHSYVETLSIPILFNTLNKVKEMLREKEIPFFEYIPSVKHFGYYSGKYDAYTWDYDDTYNNPYYTASDYFLCTNCHKAFHENELITCLDDQKKIKYYCPDCCVNHVNWCIECGEPFESSNEKEKVCLDCIKKRKRGKKK